MLPVSQLVIILQGKHAFAIVVNAKYPSLANLVIPSISAGWCALKLSGAPRLGFSWEPLSLHATYPDRKVYIFKKALKKNKRAKPHRIQ